MAQSTPKRTRFGVQEKRKKSRKILFNISGDKKKEKTVKASEKRNQIVDQNRKIDVTFSDEDSMEEIDEDEDSSAWTEFEETTEKITKYTKDKEFPKTARREMWSLERKDQRSNILSKYYRQTSKTTTSSKDATKMTKTRKETKQYSMLPTLLEATQSRESLLDFHWNLLNKEDVSAITVGRSFEVPAVNPFKEPVSSRSFLTNHMSSINRISDIFVRPKNRGHEGEPPVAATAMDLNNNHSVKLSENPQFLIMIIVTMSFLFIALLSHVLFKTDS